MTLDTAPTEAAVKKPKKKLTLRKEGIRKLKLFFKKSGKGAEGWRKEEAEKGALDLEMKVENVESHTDEAKPQEVGLGVEERVGDELKDMNDNQKGEAKTSDI